MMDNKKLLGVRVKHLRENSGWTQEHLAEKMDISTNYLSSIERGKENPTFDLLIKLSEALGAEMWEMFDYGHEVAPKELREALKKYAKELTDEQLKSAVRILKALVR